MLGNADSFSRYGTGATSRDNMVKGKWSAVGSGSSCETTNPPAGGTHHLRVVTTTSPIEPPRDAYGQTLTDVIHRARFYPTELPGNNNAMAFWTLRDANGDDQLSLMLYSTGHIALKRGGVNGTEIAVSDAAVFIAGAYQYVEFRAGISNTVGTCSVRYNGVAVAGLSGLTGLDTQETSLAEVSQYLLGRSTSSSSALGKVWDIADEDWIIPDDGEYPDDFIGDTAWRYNPADADGALTDFVRNTGATDVSCIDDTAPDDDTTYIEASTAGDQSDFGVTDIPSTVSEVVGVIAVAMARKTDTGDSSLRLSIVSADASPETTLDGDTVALSQTYAYQQLVAGVDPATGVGWTRDGVNAARLKLEKMV